MYIYPTDTEDEVERSGRAKQLDSLHPHVKRGITGSAAFVPNSIVWHRQRCLAQRIAPVSLFEDQVERSIHAKQIEYTYIYI